VRRLVAETEIALNKAADLLERFKVGEQGRRAQLPILAIIGGKFESAFEGKADIAIALHMSAMTKSEDGPRPFPVWSRLWRQRRSQDAELSSDAVVMTLQYSPSRLASDIA